MKKVFVLVALPFISNASNQPSTPPANIQSQPLQQPPSQKALYRAAQRARRQRITNQQALNPMAQRQLAAATAVLFTPENQQQQELTPVYSAVNDVNQLSTAMAPRQRRRSTTSITDSDSDEEAQNLSDTEQ